MKLTSTIVGVALVPLLLGCGSSAYVGARRTPAVLWGPGAGMPGPGTPRVHLQLDPPDSTLPEVELREVAGLEEQAFATDGPMGSWRGTRLVPGSAGVCPVPCGAIIDGRQDREFFFGGEGVRSSSHFQLGNEAGEVSIKVRPSSGVQWKAGEGLAIAGAPLLLFGTILLGGIFSSESDSRTKSSALAPAVVFTGTSAALLAAGITLMLTGGTRYWLTRAPPPRIAR